MTFFPSRWQVCLFHPFSISTIHFEVTCLAIIWLLQFPLKRVLLQFKSVIRANLPCGVLCLENITIWLLSDTAPSACKLSSEVNQLPNIFYQWFNYIGAWGSKITFNYLAWVGQMNKIDTLDSITLKKNMTSTLIM